ncbi:response regulator [Rhizobium sp. K1/93]|nr:response regulator [Rhizobium sp. L58/93]MBO9188110.1 response regulator [Rhizobium sp. E27B/91]QXZ87479.1 response regulator [Rhizobium sp. K1/93]QXZ93501.1 response regulator [Rhizobium sp. K15/93]
MIRSAGKATTVLQLFAVVLIVVLASIYSDISSRYSTLQDGVRENAMWSVYQLDREARTLKETLDDIVDLHQYGQEKLNFLALNYNILYSRITTLEDSHFERSFVADPRVVKLMEEVRRTVLGATPLFDDVDAGKSISAASLSTLNYEIGILVRKSGDLLTYTNSTLSSERADERSDILNLERKSLILIGLLVLCVVILVLTLRRQLHGVRAAGRSVENMAERVNLAYQAAEDGNRAKSQFMATMGHEIRTPLNAILGMVEILELSPLSADVAAGVRTIHRSGEALLDIINEILDFSKIEHGNLELESRRVDLRAMAESAVEIMRGRAVESGNEVRLDMPPELKVPCIVSDPTRIRQVVLNLMSNALKFTSKGKVILRLRESQIGAQKWLRVEIQDTGIGIDQSGMEKLFQPFSQVDASITRKYGGTGLGLTICKQIVERLGGQIGVTTAVGRGSTFWFEIPIELAPGEVPADVTEAPGEILKLRVLLVDDNAVNREVASRMLVHLGQHVVVAGDGQEALDITDRERFDLILMDMQMPVMDGIEATQKIKARNNASSSTPIVAMTANASEADQRRCSEAGMSGFRSKPVSIAGLRSLLADFAVESPSVSGRAAVTPQARPLLSDPYDRRKAEIVGALGEDVFQELLQTFFTDANAILASLHEALSTGDHDRIKRMLHSLNGAAINVGLADIAATSNRLETEAPSAKHIDELASVIRQRRRALAA